ncbi:MAG: hypothetical protein NE330_23390 [Lentisphaeraceae bacterium]|nr:hypothetical protein [Lentisphaeraceae bacterium]
MNVQELLKASKFSEALIAQKKQVQANPAVAKERYLLSILFAFNGEWERSSTQLSVATQADDKNYGLIGKIFQTLLKVEAQRRAVFSGESSPLVFGKPKEWLIQLIQSLKADSEKDFETASKLRSEAQSKADAISGKIDGHDFEWIADTDERLGPVLEAIVDGKYYWVPFCYIRSLSIAPPTQLTDYLWTPAKITWQNGGQTEAYLPSRYPDSEKSDDEQIKLARKTNWSKADSSCEYGLGQKVLFSNSEDFSLLDIRSLVFEQDEALLEQNEPKELVSGES